ncbi:MAG: LPS export ABC transporter periplasmic protein LptC, partial [Candidatus Binatia bacterium]
GRVHVNGEQDITRMELRGDIKMQIGDFFLQTQEAVYESERNIVSASSPVHITGRGFTAEGQSYTVEVADKRVSLTAGVATTVAGENAGGNG